MNQHLQIKNLGPIDNCDLELKRMILLDGPQAAGKSTIAKTIFFFRTIKDDFLKMFLTPVSNPVESAQQLIKNKFQQMFGSIENNTSMTFEYAPNIKIEISNQVNFSNPIIKWLNQNILIDSVNKNSVYAELQNLFQDEREVVYIPAGRSMLSILTNQLNYIFAILDDNQKNMIDYCTRNYIERIFKIKSWFQSDREIPELIQQYFQRILNGQYSYLNGEERLQINSDKMIKINFASSGQQEALWILNLIYYYMVNGKSTCFIIEEPESHLYPNSQKDMAEFIALALSDNNECIVTTHSPYMLGTFNNLLDIHRLMNEGIDVSNVLRQENLSKQALIRREEFVAYFVDKGSMMNALDEENGLICSELIDEASDDINRMADKLFELESEA